MVLGQNRDLALRFKELATLRTDAPLFTEVEQLRWHGPQSDFEGTAGQLGEPRLISRARRIAHA
jgi:hypothetical protein